MAARLFPTGASGAKEALGLRALGSLEVPAAMLESAPRFAHLVSSGRTRALAVSPVSWGASTAVHVLLLLLAAAAASRLADPFTQTRSPEEVRFLQIAEPEAPAPRPEPAPIEPPPLPEVAEFEPTPQEITRPDLLAGFQELLPPREVTGIPDPSIGALVDPADFSGRGVVGGVAGGRRALAGDTAGASRSEVLDENALLLPEMLYEQPRILNLSDVAPRMEDLYPTNLRAIGAQGRVTVEFIVDAKGRIEPTSVKFVESSHVGFEAPTRALLQLFRWAPGRHALGGPVRTLVQMPVDWAIIRRR